MNLRAPLLTLRMTRLAAEGLFVRCPPCVRACARMPVCVVRASQLLGHTGHLCWAYSVFNNPSTPSEKERSRETGPVQIHYTNHLEDGAKEKRRGRKVGHSNKLWALTL